MFRVRIGGAIQLTIPLREFEEGQTGKSGLRPVVQAGLAINDKYGM